jgi:mono/diheme cytochrome c family protein
VPQLERLIISQVALPIHPARCVMRELSMDENNLIFLNDANQLGRAIAVSNVKIDKQAFLLTESQKMSIASSKPSRFKILTGLGCVATVSAAVIIASCGGGSTNSDNGGSPGQAGAAGPNAVGSATSGQAVFRSETFGNEGFWTDAAKLPQGIVAAKATPMDALKLGLSVNVDALDAATQKAVADEIAAQGTNGPLLNSFDTTVKLLNANAIIGVVVKPNAAGKIDVANGSKVGVSCVLCHGITDGAAYKGAGDQGGGSIGHEVDGPSPHNLAVGKIFALAANTRALFPMAQLQHTDGTTNGRAPRGLTKTSTEADFDAYFSNTDFYPLGSFDDTDDGNGNPMHITPLFRQDLAAPYGSAGELAKLDQFSNTVYTALLDPTDLLTPGGKAFLHTVAGSEGDALAADYAEVLAATGVKPRGTPGVDGGYPFLTPSGTGTPGDGDSLVGLKVDHQKLIDMSAYLSALRSPQGTITDAAAVGRGRALFASQSVGCTSCHNVDQSQAVQSRIIEMTTIFPGDNPKILASRAAPASPVEDTLGNTFDDKMIVINASLRGLTRGAALPLLMDLARKPVFLHDNSVANLDTLLNPVRGTKAAHPFYLPGPADRSDVTQYLQSLDDTSK